MTQLVQMNVMGTFEDHIAAIVLLAVEVSLLISNSEAAKRQGLGIGVKNPYCSGMRM